MGNNIYNLDGLPFKNETAAIRMRDLLSGESGKSFRVEIFPDGGFVLVDFKPDNLGLDSSRPDPMPDEPAQPENLPTVKAGQSQDIRLRPAVFRTNLPCLGLMLVVATFILSADAVAGLVLTTLNTDPAHSGDWHRGITTAMVSLGSIALVGLWLMLMWQRACSLYLVTEFGVEARQGIIAQQSAEMGEKPYDLDKQRRLNIPGAPVMTPCHASFDRLNNIKERYSYIFGVRQFCARIERATKPQDNLDSHYDDGKISNNYNPKLPEDQCRLLEDVIEYCHELREKLKFNADLEWLCVITGNLAIHSSYDIRAVKAFTDDGEDRIFDCDPLNQEILFDIQEILLDHAQDAHVTLLCRWLEAMVSQLVFSRDGRTVQWLGL